MKLARVRCADGALRMVRVESDQLQPIAGDLFRRFWDHGDAIAPSTVGWLPPVMPSKIVGIGSNYKAHIAEMGRATPLVPKIFLKPSTAIIGHKQPIELPPGTTRVDHEAELGVVISRVASRVSVEEASSAIFGFTVVNDVTARDFQRQDGTFARAKGFNTFCPIGPVVLKTEELQERAVRCWVNGELRQDGSTADLLFDVPTLISFVSSVMTLLPGDVIATGTPSGVGPIVDGDVVEVEVEGIGRLRNPVVNREDRCSLR